LNNNLIKHYDRLYFESIKKFETDKYEIDKLIDSSTDNRFGITLLFRPDNQIKANIKDFIEKLSSIEPGQYYYPSSDIHVTVLSIIGCYSGFDLGQIKTEEYVDFIKESISELHSFEISFKGLTASPSCIMVRGFPENNILEIIRDRLRYKFKESNLQHSIDGRYFIQSFHSTIARIREELRNKEDFIDKIEHHKDFHFGRSKIDSLELVYNDWYQREKNVKKLHEFYI
jgi:2'-5' RNA ligase